MTTDELLLFNRLTILEKRVAELEARRPLEVHHHSHGPMELVGRERIPEYPEYPFNNPLRTPTIQWPTTEEICTQSEFDLPLIPPSGH